MPGIGRLDIDPEEIDPLVVHSIIRVTLDSIIYTQPTKVRIEAAD